jgi:hypothetical protein
VEVPVLKKVLAVATLAGALTGGVALTAAPAQAAVLCVHVHANINGTPVDNDTCTPA